MANKKLKKRQQAAAAMLDNSKLLVKDKENSADGKENESTLTEDMSECMDRFETWAIANGKYILAVCVLILVGVTIFLTVNYLRVKSIQENTAKLSEAVKIDQLENVLKTVSDSVPGYDAAQIRLARLYAAEKKYDQAYACYTAVADRKNDSYLAARSRLDSAYIRELAGKYAEAAAVFALIADAADVLPDLRAEGAYGAGRLFLLLKNENAARKYLSMTDPDKASTQIAAQWARLSRAVLNRLPAPAVKSVPAAKAAPPVKTAPAPVKKAAPAVKTAPAPVKKAAPAQKPAPAKTAPAAKK